jgi:transposase-like protein
MRKFRLGPEEQERLIKCFVDGETARSATLLVNQGRADETKIDIKTVAYYYHRLRIIIDSSMGAPVGTIKFGYKGGGVPGMEPVFGIIIQDGEICTQVYPSKPPPAWWGEFEPEGVVCADKRSKAVSASRLDLVWSGHLTPGHSAFSVDKQSHREKIQDFWDQSKQHLLKFRGIHVDRFPLVLTECVWRYMYSDRTRRNQLLMFARNEGLNPLWEWPY